ncbi:hypothetical protein SESBI_33673 [Sesbania bispinosa]|nr:hypothetical protein SESBI_33673 [Sesbania bispinosa]
MEGKNEKEKCFPHLVCKLTYLATQKLGNVASPSTHILGKTHMMDANPNKA